MVRKSTQEANHQAIQVIEQSNNSSHRKEEFDSNKNNPTKKKESTLKDSKQESLSEGKRESTQIISQKTDLSKGNQDSIEEKLFNQACKENSEIDSEEEAGNNAAKDEVDEQTKQERFGDHSSYIEDDTTSPPNEPLESQEGHQNSFDRLLSEEKRKIERQLRQEYEEKLAKAKKEAIDEILIRKDTYQKICRKQLWDLFIQFCKEVILFN
jgi:hypothetical protein